MKSYKAQNVINGTFGELWIDGDYMAQVTGFKAEVSLDKSDVAMVRKLAKASKVTGMTCTGEITLNKVSSFFIRKLNDSIKAGREVVCTIISKLDDPDALGTERIVVNDATFDSIVLADWKAGTIGEESMPFTFTDWDIQDVIEE